MYISIDFGGSTIDLVRWHKNMPSKIRSLERFPDFKVANLENVLNGFGLDNVEKIFVTGGRSSYLPAVFKGIPVFRINEIEAIGKGGHFLITNYLPLVCAKAGGTTEKASKRLNKMPGKFLVVSMGTGTCMVLVNQKSGKYVSAKHVGGTGVGGGTFLALAKHLINETDLEQLKDMFAAGNKNKVDLNVSDIIGEGIGIVPANATASNLGKMVREIDFDRTDLAAGIANLIGQTIGVAATFAALANHADVIVLTGKLTVIKKITEIILDIGKLYKIPIIVPKHAEYVGALGAGSAGSFGV